MSAYMCEACGKQFARPDSLKAITTGHFKRDGSVVDEERWVLCRQCGTALSELVEGKITGGELLPERRTRR